MTAHRGDDAPLPWGAGPYSIKRHGVTITNCDTEPIQTPGCIQAHGALLVLRTADLTILQASENSESHLGLPPERLLGEPVERVVGSTHSLTLRKLLEQGPAERNALFAFTMPGRGGTSALDVCVHTVDGVVLLEFEATDRAADGDQRDLFTPVKLAVVRLQAAPSVREFCQRVTQEVRQITGLDRVMVYRFHADQHGEVFAESRRDDLAPWLGLHYPEADIPRPAREIFKRTGVRPLPDAAGPPVEMVPLTNPDTGRPPDMTHCALRGASVMYTEYLRNMGVAATLTMPILLRGELWGLIACHHQTPTHFAHSLRAACEFLAQVASLQLEAAEHTEHLAYRLHLEGVHQQLVAKAAVDGDLMALTGSQPSLLDALQCGGTALFHLDRWWCAGLTPSAAQLDALAGWLDQRDEFLSATRPVFATDALASQYPAASAYADVGSGLLAVRVSRLRRDLILWFRPETIQSVRWAGDPTDKPVVPGPHGARLTPRASFELFVASVQQRALPWLSVEVDAALRLRLLVMELVVSRAERLAALNVDLTRSNEELDAFAYVASHDLKEPLRGIHRYAHLLLESEQGVLAENRQRLEGLMRLAVRMDTLLDSLLHYSRVGRTTLALEPVRLDEVVDEALEMVWVRRIEKPCQIERPRPLPTVECDAVRVREIYSNLLSNALKYSLRDRPRIEIGHLAPGEDDAGGARADAPAAAEGQNIYYVRDDGIGIEARHFDPIFRMFKRLHGHDEFGGGLGAGLTIVEKLVQRHGGRIWLESTLALGSTFYFTLAPPAEAAL